MIIIRNNIIPFRGFKAINILGILFARKEANITARTINHERIHTWQIYETLLLFYPIYIIEWFIRLFINRGYAYKNISFEREAYANDSNIDYVKNRKLYSWVKYFKNN